MVSWAAAAKYIDSAAAAGKDITAATKDESLRCASMSKLLSGACMCHRCYYSQGHGGASRCCQGHAAAATNDDTNDEELSGTTKYIVAAAAAKDTVLRVAVAKDEMFGGSKDKLLGGSNDQILIGSAAKDMVQRVATMDEMLRGTTAKANTVELSLKRMVDG
ncbi:hypothetical protein PHYSODRAFT_284397 [Phytophthora sojae]|uniref:Uncharacterized protein n=1 Tax=Phytophthora sojae (strain P6497) TaxID=1094619 RepID=G4YMS5_PHYSP|nr:hypothetical protein PHYSODRAFT_284397 [Phytophthora sojae]EGZ29271.1 hypothetical protein PHYSODRAFT_284397 [Phytophthora sojae]|eukprot:XP_009516546.1 hypothetical protein PHYSODRAFT_284397 [Phytophthora sojae]